MTNHPNRSRRTAYEISAAAAARAAGWRFDRAARYWTHRDYATFDGPAAELCDHYRIDVFVSESIMRGMIRRHYARRGCEVHITHDGRVTYREPGHAWLEGRYVEDYVLDSHALGGPDVALR